MRPIHFKFSLRQQELIWQKRRNRTFPSLIAQELDMSRALVSKTQRIAEERIEKILRHIVSTNRIRIQRVSPRYGFASGYCYANKSDVYIVYSPTLGTQLWLNHRGNCSNCCEQSVCEKTIRTIAHEWKLPLPQGLPVTEATEELFIAIMRRLKWIE